MRLEEFDCTSVLTKVGHTSKDTKNPDGTFSPLGKEQVRPIPLTANKAVKLDKLVKLKEERKKIQAVKIELQPIKKKFSDDDLEVLTRAEEVKQAIEQGRETVGGKATPEPLER